MFYRNHTKSICLVLFSDIVAVREVESLKEFVSMREYYAYKFQMRPKNSPNILNTGRELLQYAVNMYVKIETQRLDFFRSKQKDIRTELL